MVEAELTAYALALRDAAKRTLTAADRVPLADRAFAINATHHHLGTAASYLESRAVGGEEAAKILREYLSSADKDRLGATADWAKRTATKQATDLGTTVALNLAGGQAALAGTSLGVAVGVVLSFFVALGQQLAGAIQRGAISGAVVVACMRGAYYGYQAWEKKLASAYETGNVARQVIETNLLPASRQFFQAAGRPVPSTLAGSAPSAHENVLYAVAGVVTLVAAAIAYVTWLALIT